MRIAFFTIPVHDDEAAKALDTFLVAHRVAAIDRHFVANGAHSFWAIAVEFVAGEPGALGARKGKVDYRELLPEAEFNVYAKLRTLRKQVAEKDGVPPYALFTNEQLAAMVQRRVLSKSALEKIDGIGPARTAKYGDAFLKLLGELIPSLAPPLDAKVTVGGPAPAAPTAAEQPRAP